MKNVQKLSLQVRVHDGFTGQYVENVRVVLPQTGQSFTTDAQGMTQHFTPKDLPGAFSALPHRIRPDWQEVCLLLYHEDYVDTVIWPAAIPLQGDAVLEAEIFQKNDLPSQQVVVSPKYPEDLWLDRLLHYYR